MRASELFNLTWDRVDWQKMAIKLEADDARNAYQKLAESLGKECAVKGP